VRQVLERGTREAVKDVEEVLVNKGVKTVAEPGVELVEVGMSFPLALALVVTLWPANWRENGSFERKLINQNKLRRAAERQSSSRSRHPGR
jgi:hypothetical protein